MTNLKRTALITAIAVGLARGHWIVLQVSLMTKAPHLTWANVVPLVTSWLFLIPLPVLLFILYRSDVSLLVSKGLKNLAFAIALVQAVLAAPKLYGWILILPPAWTSFRSNAAGLMSWLQSQDATIVIRTTLVAFSELAFVVFLFALFRYITASSENGGRQSSVLRETAAFTTIATGIAAIITIGLQLDATLEGSRQRVLTPHTPGLGTLLLNNLLSGLPSLCSMAATYIIYRSQTTAIHESTVEEGIAPQEPGPSEAPSA